MTASQAPTNDEPTEQGEMFFFKSFPASSVINKNITISWDGVVGVESTLLPANVQVYNGTIDRWSGTDFPVQSELATVRQLIDSLTLLDESIPFTTIQNSETVANVPSESTVTVVIRMNDLSSVRDGTITIQNITVGDTLYDFESGTIAEEVSGRNGGDRGLVTPSAVTVPVPASAPTGVTVRQNLAPYANIKWDAQADATSFNIYWKHNLFSPEFIKIATVTDNKHTDKRVPYHKQNCASNNSLCDKYIIEAVNATGSTNATEVNFGLIIPTRTSNVENFGQTIDDRITYRQARWIFDSNWNSAVDPGGLANLRESVYWRIGSNETDIHITNGTANDGTFTTNGNDIFGQKITVPAMNLTRIIFKYDFNTAFPTFGNVSAFVWNTTNGFIDVSNDTVHFPNTANIIDVTNCSVTSCDSDKDQDFLFHTQVPLSAGEYVFGIRHEGIVSSGTHGQGKISSNVDSGVRVSDTNWKDGVTFVEDVGSDSNIQVIGIADNWVLCTAVMDHDDDDFVCPTTSGQISPNQEVWIQAFGTTDTPFGRSAYVPISSFSPRELGFTPAGGLINASAIAGGSSSLNPPAQVTGLVITQEMNNNATLDWDDATNADNYQVLRSTNFTETEQVNGNSTWQFRQQKNGVGGNTSACSISVSSGTSGNVLCNWSDTGASTGSVYIFKTFPRDMLNNTSVQISMSETVGQGSPPHTFKTFRIHTSDDFFLDRNDEAQWTVASARNWNSFNNGANITGGTVRSDSVVSLTTQSTFDSTLSKANWNNVGASDFSSIIWEMNDLNSLAGFADTRVFWINITDLDTGLPVAFYNFSGGSRVNEAQDGGCSPVCARGFINAGTVIRSDIFKEVGTPIPSDFEDSTIPLQGVSTYKVRGNSTTSGFGLNSTEVEFGLIQPITNLNATALNSTAIKLTWDLAKTEHPTDPLTGVIIQRVSPESIVYACSVCGSTGVEVGPLPNKVYGQRITLNQTETIDKIVNQQRWFNGAVTGGFIDVFIAHPNGTLIQSSVEVRSAATIGQGGQSLADRTYTFSPGVTLVAGVYDFMTRWNGVGFTNAVTGKNAGDPNAGVRVLDSNNNFNDGYTPITVSGEDTTIFLNTTGFVTIVTVDDLVTMFNDTGLLDDTTYTYRAKGQSAVSTGSFGENDTATTPLLVTGTINAPTGFAGIANTTDITLSWNNQTDRETWTLSRNGSDIVTGLTNLTFNDPSVTLDTNFGYILTAVNTTAGITNSTSEIVIKSNDIPSVVTGVGAMPINGVAIVVEWDDPVTDDGEGSPTTGLNVLYDIFRRDVGLGDPFTLLTTIPEGIALFNDTTVIGGHTFSYQISSRNEVGSAANSTEASAMVDNALVIRALESDGITDLNGDVSFRVFNSTFTSTKIGDGQGRASFPTLSGIYNFTIFHIPTDFLINKTTSSVVVTPINDVVVDVTTQVHRVNCASNGPAPDFLVLVNSTSPDHFISDFTSPVCDVDDKVSWNVLFEGFQGAAINGTGGGGGGPTTAKETPIFSLIGEDGAIDPVTDLASSDFFIGQLFDLSGQMPIGTSFSVEKIIVSILDTNANDGNYTGVILNNVTQGGFVSNKPEKKSTPSCCSQKFTLHVFTLPSCKKLNCSLFDSLPMINESSTSS